MSAFIKKHINMRKFKRELIGYKMSDLRSNKFSYNLNQYISLISKKYLEIDTCNLLISKSRLNVLLSVEIM